MAETRPSPALGVFLLLILLSWAACPPTVKADPWSFAVIGDQRDDGTFGVNIPIVEKMAAQIATQNPAFVLCAGDQIHGHVSDRDALLPVQYNNWLSAMTSSLNQNILYPVRGNHETYGDEGNSSHPYAYYWQTSIVDNLPQIPRNGPPNQVGMNYSFSNNNVFIVGLEQSYTGSWYQVNQTWLNQQLAANTLPLIFAYGHYPAFAFHNDLEPSSLADHPAQRDAFWKSLGDSSVNIYFSGHVHIYGRARVSIDGGPEIQQIVVGTGGAELMGWDGRYDDPRVIPESHLEGQYGYDLVTVNGNTVTVVYYAYDGVNTWTPFDIYTYTITSRNFGANDANQSIDPATLSNYYSGISLMKIGQGTLTLNAGASTYSDAIVVSAGGLNVQGDYRHAPVDVLLGGTLSGTGTVGSVTNSGTVSPGNSPGTLSVVGSYTQAASGTLRAEIASSTNYDKLSVTGAPGTATLAGTLAPVLLGGYRPSAGQVFTGVITATGGVVGTFGNVTQPLTLNWQPVYNANSVDLQFQPNYANQSLSLTSNGQSAGNMLQGLAGSATGDLNNVLNTIDHMNSPGQVRDAFQQISHDKATSLPNLGFAGARLFQQGIAGRINNLRYAGLGGGGLAGLGGLSLRGSRLDGLMLAYNSSSLAGLLSAKKEAAPETRWGVYVNPGMVIGSQAATSGQTGFDYLGGGFTAGADYRVTDDLLVGLATGYSHTATNFHGSGGGSAANTWPLMAYAAYLPKSFYAYGSLGYGLNFFDLDRSIPFASRTASSSTTGHQFNAYGEAGYDWQAKSLVVTPLVTLAYSSLWVNGFTESGADSLNLKVSPQNAQSLQTGVGARVSVPLRRNSIAVTPQVYATYQHEFMNGARGVDARLNQGGSTFAFQTEHPGRDFAVVGASLIIVPKRSFALQLNYNAEVGRARSTAHLANALLRWEF